MAKHGMIRFRWNLTLIFAWPLLDLWPWELFSYQMRQWTYCTIAAAVYRICQSDGLCLYPVAVPYDVDDATGDDGQRQADTAISPSPTVSYHSKPFHDWLDKYRNNYLSSEAPRRPTLFSSDWQATLVSKKVYPSYFCDYSVRCWSI